MRQPSDTRSPTAMDGGIEGLKRFPDPASGAGEEKPRRRGRRGAGGSPEESGGPSVHSRGVIDGAIKLRGTATFLVQDSSRNRLRILARPQRMAAKRPTL